MAAILRLAATLAGLSLRRAGARAAGVTATFAAALLFLLVGLLGLSAAGFILLAQEQPCGPGLGARRQQEPGADHQPRPAANQRRDQRAGGLGQQDEPGRRQAQKADQQEQKGCGKGRGDPGRPRSRRTARPRKP